MIDIAYCDEKPKPNDFEPVLYNDLPKIFVGLKLRNEFDNKITSNIPDSQSIFHIAAINGVTEPIYLRGAFLDPTPKAVSIANDIREEIDTIDWQSIYNKYVKILRRYNISCQCNFSHLMDGVYPIDPIYFHDVVDGSYSKLKKDVELFTKSPWYFRPEIKIFILEKCNAFLCYNSQ
jgi:hypothetical protein